MSMEEEGEIQESGDAVEVVETPEPETKSGRREQPMHKQFEAEQSSRGANGKFSKKERVPDGIDMREIAAIARDALAGKDTRLPKETDADALDGVKPKGQDQAQGQDPNKGAKPIGATKSTSKNAGEKAAPATEQQLDKARKALALTGHDEEDLALLTPEQTLALGKKAEHRNAEKSREMREAAAAKNGQKSPASAAGESDEEGALFEGLVKEHFSDFEDNEPFQKSLAGFAKATNARLVTSLKAEIEGIGAAAAKQLSEIKEDMRMALHLELGTRAAASRFPKAVTKEGRESVLGRARALMGTDKNLDASQAIEDALLSLYKGENDRANAERQSRIDAAKQGSHSDVRSSGEAPRKVSDFDIGRQAVREAMSRQR